MRTPFHSVLLFLLWGLPAMGQTDSSGIRGTIHVSRPDVRAMVTATVEYAVYFKRSEAPRLGKLNGSKQKYVKSKDLSSFGQNEEDPKPLVERYHLVKLGPGKPIQKTDIPFDTLRVEQDPDSVVDLCRYLSDTIKYFYKYSDNSGIDTVQLLIRIDKKGRYRYSFASRTDSLSKPGPKCMEALTGLRKWLPAHVYYSPKQRSFGHGKAHRKKAYSEALVTIVLTANSDLFEIIEPSSKK